MSIGRARCIRRIFEPSSWFRTFGPNLEPFIVQKCCAEIHIAVNQIFTLHRGRSLWLLVRLEHFLFSESQKVIYEMSSSILDYSSSPPHKGLIAYDSAAVRLLVSMSSLTNESIRSILTFES